MIPISRRGNPNWGRPEPPQIHFGLSDFESLVKSLGLSPEQYVSSAPLRAWVEKNKDQKYVPPELLEAWGFEAKSEV